MTRLVKTAYFLALEAQNILFRAFSAPNLAADAPPQEEKPHSHGATALDPNSNTWVHVAQGIPMDLTVLFTNVTLQYPAGGLASTTTGVYNHHVTFVSSAKTSPQFMACPGADAGSAALEMPSNVMGESEELTW